MKTPLVVVTGYLGAGKTTLLRSLIEKTKGRRVAIVMNEFGEVGIDSKTVKGNDVDMTELTGGCVCCSITGELEAALKEVIAKVRPELIVLETTGVAEPDAIVDLVDADLEDVRLDSVITVVDADALTRSPSIGHTGRVQIEVADVLLLNKADLVDDPETLEAMEEQLRAINGRAQLYQTVRCDVDWAVLVGLYRPKKNVKHGVRDHIDVSSFIVKPNALSKKKFEEFAASLPAAFYRAKGFVRLDGRTHLFNYVNGRYELEEWKDENSVLVFIGRNVQRDRKRIEKALKRCV